MSKAKKIYKEKSYFDMSPEEEKIVIKYETKLFKKRIKKLYKKQSKKDIENTIHDWWLDYLMHDETEIILYKYLETL